MTLQISPWHSFLPNSIADLAATVLGILITIGAYVYRDYRKERKRKKRRLLYFKFLLDNAISVIESNISSLNDSIKKLEEYPLEIKPIEQKINGDLRRILFNTDLEDVFNIILQSPENKFKKFTFNQFKSLISKVDFFKEMDSHIILMFQNGINNDLQRRLSYNDTFIQAAKKLPSLQKYYAAYPNPVRNELRNIITLFSKDQDVNMTNWKFPYSSLGIPIVKFLKMYPRDEEIYQEYRFLFEKIIFEYGLINMGNLNFKKELIDIYNEMQSNILDVKKNKDILSSIT